MYTYLLFFHALVRWFVLISLLYALCRGIRGWIGKRTFSQADDTARHVASTIAQLQLTIGYVLYFNSPVVAYFFAHYREAVRQSDFRFFGMIHVLLMTIAIFVITIGSSVAKRHTTDKAKFSVMTLYFAIALLIIFLAIPWPFSPLANRPLFRSF